jgi:pimeloyl-ACP methyl ester carboxylesterase
MMPFHLGVREKARRLFSGEKRSRSRDGGEVGSLAPIIPLDPTQSNATARDASAAEGKGPENDGHTPVPPGIGPILKGTNIGLTTLYEPEDASKAAVDIVFVHGLMGNAFDTWYDEGGMMHWPSTLLKDDIKTARILAFGYDADVASFWGGAAQNRISNHASNMIGHIVGLREETDSGKRKIIFVVHSLGGLVTERALSMSENHAEEHLQQVEACTVGILFLGTPHHGSGLAPFAKSVAKVLGAVGKRVNTEILEVLKRDSQVLLDVEDWFAQWLRRRAKAGNNVDITCFFEEMELPGIGKVVSEDSAMVSGYATYSIHADHMVGGP